MKPHLKVFYSATKQSSILHSNVRWLCTGNGQSAYGATPKAAYLTWFERYHANLQESYEKAMRAAKAESNRIEEENKRRLRGMGI